MARRRRRSSRRMSSKKVLKGILIILAIVLVIIIAIALVKHFSGNKNQVAGISGVVTIDGNTIGVFEKADEAAANRVVLDAGKKTLKVSGSGNIDVSAKPNVITENGGKYELNLDGLADGTTVDVKVLIGGDGSLFSKRFDAKAYYFSVQVNNPDVSAGAGTPNAATLGLPTGVVHFGDTTFQTYGSEVAAQSAVAAERNKFTIPTSMAKALVLTAEPSGDTARIWALVCMVDGEDVFDDGQQVRLNQDSAWTGTFDVSQYAGHQVTICLKAENGLAISNGYSYVSFFVPEF